MSGHSIWLPYETVKQWVQQKGFRNYKQFRQYAKTHILPEGVPACPQSAYKDDFISDTDFFGEREPEYLPYDIAMMKARRMKFATMTEYQNYCREHERNKTIHKLPIYPQRAYPTEFVDWPTFLGNDNVANTKRTFLPYKEARKFIHQLNLKNYYDWYEWANRSGDRPRNIPSNPWDVYEEWNGIKEWLGTNLTARLQAQTENYSVLCFVQSPYGQSNEYSYAVFHGGTTQALRECAQSELNVVAMYKHVPTDSGRVAEIIDNNSSSHFDQEFVAINIHAIFYEIGLFLDRA